MKLRDLHPRRFFLDTWRASDAEAAERRATAGTAPGGSSLALFVFAVAAVSLTLQEYLGTPDTFFSILTFLDAPSFPVDHPTLHALLGWLSPPGGGALQLHLMRTGRLELWNLGYWALWRVFGFGVIPVLAVLIHPGMRLSDMGLSVRGFSEHAWVYGVLFAPVLMAVVAVSLADGVYA